MNMTKTEAIEYAVSHEDHDQLDADDLRAAYVALYGQEPDDDEARDMWSHIHAHSDVQEAVEAAEQAA